MMTSMSSRRASIHKVCLPSAVWALVAALAVLPPAVLVTVPSTAGASPAGQTKAAPVAGRSRGGKAGSSAAVDLTSLRARADRVEAQVAGLDRRLERLVEQYDRARERQDDVAGRLALARLALARVTRELQVQEALLQQRLSDMYKMGEYSLLDVVVTASGFDEAQARIRFFRLIAEQDAAAAALRARLVNKTGALTAQIADERDRAAQLTRIVQEKERMVQARLAEREAVLANLDERIRREVERRREAARREAERLAHEAGVDLTAVQASAEQIAVVREAMRYLGVPYLYGGAAPGTGFDCSGLVMYVYAKFGVNLPHFAAWQEEKGTPVPFDRLQPADLVFFGSPIHHVGMYVGKGRFIHAPHTGDVVRIAVLAERTDLTAACRYRPRLPEE